MMDNPVNFADKLNPVKFYLLCEERSLYRRQAAEFFKRFASRLPIENRLSAGKKMTHGWNFWESPEVLRTIEDCLK